jgi:alpha-mannosidase
MVGFSHIAWALSQVTKGGGKDKFVSAKPQQKSFVELKHSLCSTPILAKPDLW